MSLNDTIETLVYLGLSLNQAKVYLKTGSRQFSSVCEIQKKADVPRQEIYRILDALNEIGLVEASIERPRKYKSMSINEGISFLLKKKNEETATMNKKAELLLKNVGYYNDDSINGFEPDFVLIPKNHATIIRRRNEIFTALKTIDFLISWKRFPPTVETLGDTAKKALDKGVRIRVLLEKPEKGNNFPKIGNDLRKHPNYEIKFIDHEPSALIGIFDNKRVIIDTSTDSGFAEKSSLLSNNPGLVSIVIDYFDKIWEEIPAAL